jgi:ABC-type lipoprotein export system ATPase subunit
MGASGSGKSTFLHILGALDIPDSGRVEFAGDDVFGAGRRFRERIRNESIGFVFQFYHLLPELNLLENVLFPAMVRYSVGQWLRRGSRARAAAREVLDRVGLAERARHRPNELSGGERQRAAIARALVNGPQLLLADEPTGNLDAGTGRGILAVLRELNENGQTVVMVTHDPNVASQAHRSVHLVDGRIKA